MLCVVFERKGWGLPCDAKCCIGRQRMGTAMWRYVSCWKAKNGNWNLTLCSVLEGKGWGLPCDAMCCVGRQRMGSQRDQHELQKKTWPANLRAQGKNFFVEIYNVVQYLTRRICRSDTFICLLHVKRRHQIYICGVIITGQWLQVDCEFLHMCKLLAKDYSFDDRAKLQILTLFHCKGCF